MKFPDLPAASALTGAEIVPLTQSSVDKRTTVQGVADFPESKGADIASAATTDLSTATGPFVHVTGTTTITALGTMQAGTQRVVVFDGILTLTHNATSLILPTAASITTAAGDVAVFRSEGSGNWRCTGYTRASGEALAASSGASDEIAIVTEASAFTADPSTHSGRSKLILAGGDVTFDDAETYVAGNVFNIRATAGLDLVEDGVTLTEPSGGSLGLSQDMAVTVVMTGATAGVVIGQTVAAS